MVLDKVDDLVQAKLDCQIIHVGRNYSAKGTKYLTNVYKNLSSSTKIVFSKLII